MQASVKVKVANAGGTEDAGEEAPVEHPLDRDGDLPEETPEEQEAYYTQCAELLRWRPMC